MNYIVFDNSGTILRTVVCSPAMIGLQISYGKFVMRGTANDSTQKIEFDGFDSIGQPVNPRVVDKTPEEIEVDNPIPPEIPFERKPAHITNEQWQAVQNRISNLEKNM